VSWNNTKHVKGDLVAEVRRMKKDPGEEIVILEAAASVAAAQADFDR